MEPTRRRRRGPLPPGIQRIHLPSGESRYRLQLGPRGKGNRRSKLFPCTDAGLAEAIALRREWIARGLPPKGSAAPRDDVIATVDDGLRHRVLDLESRGKSGAAVAERIRVFLKRHWVDGSTLPLSSVTVATLEEYRDRRSATCLPNTVIRELRELRATFKKALVDFKVPT